MAIIWLKIRRLHNVSSSSAVRTQIAGSTWLSRTRTCALLDQRPESSLAKHAIESLVTTQYITANAEHGAVDCIDGQH